MTKVWQKVAISVQMARKVARNGLIWLSFRLIRAISSQKAEKGSFPLFSPFPVSARWVDARWCPPEETREYVVIESGARGEGYLNVRRFNHAYPSHHSSEWRAGFWPTPSLALEEREVIFWLDGLVLPSV